MQLLKYKEFLLDNDLLEVFYEGVFKTSNPKETKGLNINKFWNDKHEIEDDLLFDILNSVETGFPTVERESPNVAILLFFKWVLLNMELESNDKTEKNKSGSRIQRLYANFGEYGKKTSKEYVPDEVISLYRELVLYAKVRDKPILKRLVYQDYLCFHVRSIEESSLGKALRIASLTDDRYEPFSLTRVLNRPYVPYTYGKHLLAGIIGVAIGEAVVYVMMNGAQIIAKRIRKCTLEEEKQVTAYLRLLNKMIQICARAYYTDEGEKIC